MIRKHQQFSCDNHITTPPIYSHKIRNLQQEETLLATRHQCPFLILLFLITTSCVTSFDVKPVSDTETAYLSDSESDSDTEKHPDEPEDSGSNEELETDTVEESDIDHCPDDPDKVDEGICGCGIPDVDSDSDGTFDCHDGCKNDPNKTAPGECGCGREEDTCGVDPVGAYHRLPITNNWHMGNIQETETGYLWVNAAGKSWVLVPELDSDRLLTQADCPYHDFTGGDAFTLVLNGNNVTGFYFLEELYTRQD